MGNYSDYLFSSFFEMGMTEVLGNFVSNYYFFMFGFALVLMLALALFSL